MKNSFVIVALGFAVTLAIIVGNRLSNDAMTVIVGALCGLMATVPLTIALVIALRQNWGAPRASRDDFESRAYAHQPPVVVISPPQQMGAPYGFQSNQLYLPPNVPAPGAPRDFKIIGEE
ncbi:MAG: hypothetical protein HY070_02535 [Chloroflexi bacterium]|nr:hypothetical protein [Chloroflexota bacterium]MBI3741438.1 hypothetical protein [Chloroflexota bacterium]